MLLLRVRRMFPGSRLRVNERQTLRDGGGKERRRQAWNRTNIAHKKMIKKYKKIAKDIWNQSIIFYILLQFDQAKKQMIND